MWRCLTTDSCILDRQLMPCFNVLNDCCQYVDLPLLVSSQIWPQLAAVLYDFLDICSSDSPNRNVFSSCKNLWESIWIASERVDVADLLCVCSNMCGIPFLFPSSISWIRQFLLHTSFFLHNWFVLCLQNKLRQR